MIKFENISFSFGDKVIFENFSLTVLSGITVIEGASGCGKTTLLRLAAGLLTPSSGTVTGVPEKVSFMFQEDRLLPWLTAEKNVASVLPREEAHRAAEFLEKVELSEKFSSLPDSMSGGQRRRVSLARALAYNGSLLILDEPFKGLDPALTERMAALLRSLGKDIILTSHSEYETSLMGGTLIKL